MYMLLVSIFSINRLSYVPHHYTIYIKYNAIKEYGPGGVGD